MITCHRLLFLSFTLSTEYDPTIAGEQCRYFYDESVVSKIQSYVVSKFILSYIFISLLGIMTSRISTIFLDSLLVAYVVLRVNVLFSSVQHLLLELNYSTGSVILSSKINLVIHFTLQRRNFLDF